MPSRPVTPPESVKRLFEPQSIAVVGASPASGWGRIGIQNLDRIGFSGQIGAVNPKYDEVLGYPCASSVRELPFVPDALLVSVHRDRVERVIADAVEAGVGGAAVMAIGFADAGTEGRKVQDRVSRIAREGNLALVGPNCQGLINFAAPAALYMGPVVPYEAGSVALVSQSGSVTSALTNNQRGVRWSHVVSTGNEAVVDSADVISYFLDHSSVRVVAAFLETIRDPKRFFEQCDRALALGKPVVVLKAGRSEAAQRAATAHTGALSAPDRLVDSLFSRHGVIRVDSMEELLETCIAFQGSRRPKGNRIATVTGSGGQIELVLDELTRTGLVHPAFSQGTQQQLRKFLPDFLATQNPLDYWGMEDHEERYPELVSVVAADDNVDIVVMAGDFSFGPTGSDEDAVRQMSALREVAEGTSKLCVLLDTVDGTVPAKHVEAGLSSGALVLSGLREGLAAIDHLASYSVKPSECASTRSASPVAVARAKAFSEPASGEAALALVTELGIPTPASQLVDSPEEAVSLALRLGYPVVLKSGDPRQLHKTEGAGVYVGLSSAEAVTEVAGRLRLVGDGSILVQEQIQGGVELLLGIQSDPELGTFIVVGMGGIWTEVLDDVVIGPVGLGIGEAEAMLRRLRFFKLLEGVRGAPACDLSSIVSAIERLDALAISCGDAIESLDINPLIATPTGAIAVDCLVVPMGTTA